MNPDSPGPIRTDVAHELSQPLSSISNLVEVCALQVRSGCVEPDRLLRLLSEVAIQSMRAADIVARGRNVVDKDATDLKSADLSRIVAGIPLLTLQELAESGIALRIDLPEQPLPILADELQIELVLVNLVRNAMDSIREGGRPVRMVEVGVRRNGHAAEAMVRDTGKSAASPHAGRVLDASFATGPHALGLGLSRSILEAHGGSIRMEVPCDGGPGTVVRFAIPLAPSLQGNREAAT